MKLDFNWWLLWMTTIFIGFCLIYVGIQLSTQHDKEIAKSSNTYEKCIEKQFHMSPAGVYQDRGYYPECE